MSPVRAYTDNQIEAIELDGRDICVAAGAGSGKTGVLVERFVRLVTQSGQMRLPAEQRARVDEILVITFTEKATKEMKTRIVEELTRLGLTEERRQVETAYISTIHGFCSRLLQENPFEVGIDPHFTVLEEPQARRLLRQVVETVVASAYEENDEETTELVAAIQALRRHGEDQADPVASLADAVEHVLARLRSAGCRREQLERHWHSGPAAAARSSDAIVWSVITPVLDESRAVAAELRALYAGLLGAARASCDTLAACAERAGCATAIPEALAALRDLAELVRKTRGRIFGATLAEMQLAQHMGRLKAVCETRAPLLGGDLPDTEQSALVCRRMLGVTAAVWRGYEEAKRQRGKVDNDDLQAECVRLLEEYPDVRERYRRKLRYLMVDEFQDTNPLQMRLIELLHAPEHDLVATAGSNPSEIADVPPADETGPRNYLFVVGDVQQSIYGFRGAAPGLFRALERRYREERAGAHIPLAVNFRSRPEILRLIAHLFRQFWKEAPTPFVPLEAGAGFDPDPSPSIELLLSQDLVRKDYLGLEPAALARRVRRMVEEQEVRLTSHLDPRRGEPVRYRDIAVLLRQLTDIQKYEEAFAQAGVPYFVVGGGRGYYARQEIRDMVNILTVLDTPLNDVALMAALRSPMVGADIDTLYRIVEMANGRQPPDAHVAENGAVIGGVDSAADAGRHTESAAGAGRTAASGKTAALPMYTAMIWLLRVGGLPAEEMEKLGLFLEVMDSLRAQEDRMPVGHLMERLISRTSYDARLLCRPNGRRRLANVRKLLQMANADPVLGVREFIRRLRDLEKLSDREGDAPTEEEAADVVRFHTIHGAKGLEFPVVILADLCRSLDYPARGLFVCDPHHLALGSRVCGAADPVYLAIDHQLQQADREESERLLYVAMTRARERLILCGNLGRNRGLNWGESLFSALGVNEAPPQPEVRTLIGGIAATLAPLSHYVHSTIAGGVTAPARRDDLELSRYSARLVDALLNGDPLESVTS